MPEVKPFSQEFLATTVACLLEERFAPRLADVLTQLEEAGAPEGLLADLLEIHAEWTGGAVQLTLEVAEAAWRPSSSNSLVAAATS